MGEDGLWYALDPLRGTATTAPQLLTTYLSHPDNAQWQWYVKSPTYG